MNEDDDFEKLDAAAEAALKRALSLPQGEARSKAMKEAGELRRLADGLAPRGRRPK